MSKDTIPVPWLRRHTRSADVAWSFLCRLAEHVRDTPGDKKQATDQYFRAIDYWCRVYGDAPTQGAHWDRRKRPARYRRKRRKTN